MKTLLIYPPCSPLLQGPKAQAKTNMPLGLPYLAAFLKKEGHEVSILDLNIKIYLDAKEEDRGLWHEKNGNFWSERNIFSNELLPKLEPIIVKWVDAILKSNSKVVGFYVAGTSQWMALLLAKKLREKNNDIAIIFGGPGCYREKAEQFLRIGPVDAVVMGEGEVTLLELLNSYKKTGRIELCPGVFLMKSGEVIYGGEREFIKDLDGLPYPDFSDMIDDYKTIFGEGVWLSISWLRGCTHRCAFCYESRVWGPPRPRSPESICREFFFQKQKYNIAMFNKGDSTLTFSEEMLSKTCDLLINKEINVIWGSQARPEKYLTPELMCKLYKAGCRWLSYGIESGSQAVVDRMKKGFLVKTAEGVMSSTQRAGIKLCVNIMVGSPGETLIDFIKTIQFVLKNIKSIDVLSLSSAAITPMSDWYLNPKEYGILMDDDPKKKRYYNSWRSKYFMDNRHIREIKKSLVKSIYNALS